MAALIPKQNFFCIGAQKAGTTTLADILQQHPDIFIPKEKETKFFLFPDEYSKGLGYYNATYYANYSGQKMVGELDPDYMLVPETAKRIAESLGKDVKFIVVLRNPALRAYSHYLMSKKKGIEKLGFQEALEAESGRNKDIKYFKTVAYLERGKYGSQLQAYLEVFDHSRFLFLEFEKDIVQHLDQTLQRIQSFLGVEIRNLDSSVRSNEAAEALNDSVRDLVRRPNFVKRFIKKLIPFQSMRRKARKYLINKNQQASTATRLDMDTVANINEQYFKEEILLTRKLTGLPLTDWLP
jgi:hypothetical protein